MSEATISLPTMPEAPQPDTLLPGTRAMCMWLTVVGVGLLALMGGLLTLDAVQATREALQPGTVREATLAANITLQRLELDGLTALPSQPITRLRQDMLTLLAEEPLLDYIAFAVPADGRVEVVSRPGSVRPENSELLAPDWSVRGPHSRGRAFDVALPFTSEDTAGWLHVGLRTGREYRLSIAVGLDLVAALAVLAVGLALQLRLIGETQLILPLCASLDVLSRGARGDWRSGLDTEGLDEGERLGALVATVIARMNARWERLIWLAGEVERVAPDHYEQITATLTIAQQGSAFAAAELVTVPPLDSPAASDRLVFVCVVVQFLPLGALLLAPVVADGAGLSVVLPIAVGAASVPAAIALSGWLAITGGMYLRAMVGSSVAALGAILGSVMPTAGPLVLAEALAGAGTGLFLTACHAAPKAGAHMAVVAALGAAGGLGLGAILALHFGVSSSFGTAAALSILGGLLAHASFRAGWIRVRPVSRPEPPRALAVACLSGATVTSGFATLATTAPLALAAIGLDATSCGHAITLAGLGGVAAAVLHAGPRRLQRWPVALAIAGAGVALLAGWSPVPLAALLLGLALAGFALTTLLLRSAAASHAFLLGAIAGGVFGPLFGAAIVPRLGAVSATALIGTLLLLGSVAVQASKAIAARPRRQPP